MKGSLGEGSRRRPDVNDNRWCCEGPAERALEAALCALLAYSPKHSEKTSNTYQISIADATRDPDPGGFS